MKPFYFLIYCLFVINSCFSQVISGRITEVNSPRTIPYARLQVLGKNVGAIANSEGSFLFDISDFSELDTLRISAIGYENLEFLIDHCRTFLSVQEQLIFELTPTVQLISEISVSAGKNKTVIAGNNIKSAMIVAGFQNREPGSELGTVLKYNKKNKGQIISFNFNVSGLQNDSIPIRVNLYEMKDGVPSENILKEPIYTTTKLRNGIISIDLSEENIFIKDDCFLSLELIENISFDGLFLKSGFLRSPSFQRSVSETEWKKTTVDLGIWAEIIYKK